MAKSRKKLISLQIRKCIERKRSRNRGKRMAAEVYWRRLFETDCWREIGLFKFLISARRIGREPQRLWVFKLKTESQIWPDIPVGGCVCRRDSAVENLKLDTQTHRQFKKKQKRMITLVTWEKLFDWNNSTGLNKTMRTQWELAKKKITSLPQPQRQSLIYESINLLESKIDRRLRNATIFGTNSFEDRLKKRIFKATA